MPGAVLAAGAVEQQRYAMLLQQAEQLMVGRVAERHLLVQVSEPVKIVYGVAGFGLVGGLFGGNALDAGGRKVHLAAIGVPHAADTLVMRPGHGRVGLAGGLSGAAQVQDLPQVQAFQLGTVSGALQRIQLQPRYSSPRRTWRPSAAR